MLWNHQGPKFGPDDYIKQYGPNNEIIYWDHLGGFDLHGNNEVLKSVPVNSTVHTEYLLPSHIKDLYQGIQIKFDADLMIQNNFLQSLPRSSASAINKKIENFVCCFNRGYHVGREYLVLELFNLGWFNFDYCTKGFELAPLADNVKTFCSSTPIDLKNLRKEHTKSADFRNEIRLLSPDRPYDLEYNINLLSLKIQKSFVQIVSETVPESYVPFPTEKLLFPIVNKTLWVAYAQLDYHNWITHHFGFKKHKIFDYEFDSIADPSLRLKALTNMLARFSTMTQDEWHDIYQQEKEVIEFNFEWAQSKKFITHLKNFDEASNMLSSS
jgi:hypothetical protein